MFLWRERIPATAATFGVDWAVTDVHGGVSRDGWSSLNLGASVGDDPGHVGTNRARLAEALGLDADRLVFMRQCHGASVATVDHPGHRPQASVPEADAVTTSSTELALVVLVADCTPVLLVDRRAGLAAAVHAGRPGMVGGVVGNAVARLRELGAQALQAVVGPSVCPRCYEVPASMRAEAAAVSPTASAVSWQGTPAIDVAGGVVEQLHDRQVPLRWLPGCSRESPNLFSHRRDNRAGRFAGVVRLTAPGDPEVAGVRP